MSSKTITFLLVVMCTILGNLIYYNLKNQPVFDQLETTELPKEPTSKEIQKVSTSQLANIDSYSEIIERPLFSFDRQETQEEIVTEQIPTQRPARDPNLQLIGIVLSDEGQIALIKTRKDPKVKRVKLDEKIENWTLIELQNNSVKLLSGKQEFVLEMTRKADPNKRMQLNNINQRDQRNNLPPGMSNPIPTGQRTLDPSSPVSGMDEFDEMDEEDEDEDEIN